MLTTTYALFNTWNLSGAESTLGQELLPESVHKKKNAFTAKKLVFSKKFLGTVQSHRLSSCFVIRHQNKACHLN